MPDAPLISVIVPLFNGERFLAETLDSIFAQTYRPLDVIVVDDGSTDGGAQIARSFPVHYTHQEHLGICAALNRGVALARGSYFSFLDADDLWVPTKLEQQLTPLEDDPALDMVFGHVREFQSGPNAAQPRQYLAGYFKGTLLIRRASFFRVGLFDQKWHIGDFIDWYLRASELTLNTLMLPDVLLMRRIHDNNSGTRERVYRHEYVRMLKQSLDRKNQNQ